MPRLAEVRARVETDLDDATLQTIVDGEIESLQREAGKETETETQYASGLKKIVLKRLPKSITSIKERVTLTADEVTLATDDWRQTGLYGLFRVTDGTNPASRWGAEVVIAYVPEIDTNLRDRIVFDLTFVQRVREDGSDHVERTIATELEEGIDAVSRFGRPTAAARNLRIVVPIGWRRIVATGSAIT